MDWDDSFQSGSIFLNQHLLNVKTEDASVNVHYWGAKEEHLSNHMHQHSFYEVCYIINGEGNYIENNHIRDIKKGALILSPPYTQHQILSDTGIDIIFIGFDLLHTSNELVQDLFDVVSDREVNIIYEKQNSAVTHLWISILKLAIKENIPYLVNNVDTIAFTLFCSILKEFKNSESQNEYQSVRTTSADIVYRAKLYIIDNLSDTLTLEEVAHYLHISERHLSRLFQQELGQTFSAFIRKERIRKAGILLSESDVPIKDISIQTGFKSIHYFSKVFSKEMDMPPGQFRKKFRHELVN